MFTAVGSIHFFLEHSLVEIKVLGLQALDLFLRGGREQVGDTSVSGSIVFTKQQQIKGPWQLVKHDFTVVVICSRFAKKKLDNKSFFGGILHVCYAPEFETVNDTREKLQERRKVIAKKTRG